MSIEGRITALLTTGALLVMALVGVATYYGPRLDCSGSVQLIKALDACERTTKCILTGSDAIRYKRALDHLRAQCPHLLPAPLAKPKSLPRGQFHRV